MQYRSEIDGLRALAVVPVILFHAGLGLFSGGFVGVDIFFVISGYLITTIIVNDHRANKFSLVGFYERRARRILPALYLVMLVALPIAWFTMLPDDLENFGQSLVATTLFANNVLLWKTSGYWELASELKPLLHTWSLAVEEQYYVVFPLLVMALWRTRRRWLMLVIVVITLASLAVAQWLSKTHGNFAFYLLPTRAWELLCGALVGLWVASRDEPVGIRSAAAAQAASLLGLAMIASSMLWFDRSTPNPSVFTLLPVLGTLLVIVSAREGTLAHRLLSAPLVVGIGLVSYSAYLWHQPIFAFTRLLSLEEPSHLLMAVGAALSLGLAYLSWRFVEKPFRNPQFLGRYVVFGLFVAVGAAIAITGYLFHANSGFVNRWKELDDGIQQAGRGINIAFNQSAFRFKKPGFSAAPDRKILIFGNSFARDFINAGQENHYFSDSDIVYDDASPSCMSRDRLDDRLKLLVAQSDVVIYGSPIDNVGCWNDDLAEFGRLGAKKVIVVGPKNFGWNMNAVMNLPESRRYSYRVKVLRDTLEENRRLIAGVSPDHYVDLLGMIADAEQRVPVFTPDQKLISQDRVHLTKAGAGYIGKILFEHPLLRELK